MNEKFYFSEKSKIHQITEQIFLTSFWGAKDKTQMKENKITHVVICAKELEKKFPQVCLPNSKTGI
jgi:hypothetical protein